MKREIRSCGPLRHGVRWSPCTHHSAYHRDFLMLPAAPSYDRVVMNPPFSKQQDIAHILHAYKFLAPGGRLVSIASAGVSFRTDRKATAFRTFVAERGGSITGNPEGSFKASGTNVNTVTVVIPGGAA